VGKSQIGIAMSGGVDSTACALLLQKKYEVHGFFMQLAQPDLAEQLQRVKKIAGLCSIPLQIIDLRSRFEEKVLRYFAHSYQNGYTPNPCMICNCEIKFGLFMDAICDRGIERIATGHYTKIVADHDCFFLQQGEDTKKDQSYFLARVSQKQLARVEFPLGSMTKENVYDFVEENGFADFRGQESQDVCFLGDSSIGDFLETRESKPATSGEIVDMKGLVLGRHNGIYNYTIGQRKGLGIAAATPLYVIRIDAANNRVVVGENHELFQRKIVIDNVMWTCDKTPLGNHDYQVKIRYGHQAQDAQIKHISDSRYQVSFTEKQRAITPGQFAVIYDQDLVIGSGEIQ
jgi:tRNA-specific 2-thiouridylase